MTLKERIREYVEQTDYVSFAELGNRFGSEFNNGDRELCQGENVVIWSNMTEDGVMAISELLDEGAIHLHPSSTLVYLIDGCALKLPTVRRRRTYKTPHWLPVTIRPGAR